jgi:hypothetical protein
MTPIFPDEAISEAVSAAAPIVVLGPAADPP